MSSHLPALETAVAPFVLKQDKVAVFLDTLHSDTLHIRRLMPVFGNFGIQRRYSSVSSSGSGNRMAGETATRPFFGDGAAGAILSIAALRWGSSLVRPSLVAPSTSSP